MVRMRTATTQMGAASLLGRNSNLGEVRSVKNVTENSDGRNTITRGLSCYDSCLGEREFHCLARWLSARLMPVDDVDQSSG